MSEQKKPIALVIKHPLGIFALNQAGQLIEFELFDKDVEKTAAQFNQEISQEFYKKLKDFFIEHDREKTEVLFRKNFREILSDLQIDEENFNKRLSSFSVQLSKIHMKAMFSRDKFIVQANNALEDLAQMQNICLERLHEWFCLHYPESKLSYKELASAVVKYGTRENFPDFTGSVGLELTEEDKNTIIDYAVTVSRILDQRNSLERYIKESMIEIAPNLSAILEELIAAKIMAIAGSLDKLARMSASNIQLIGAEKALFRHIRKQGKSPKYGILFISRWIQSAPEDKRGKVARILASKIMQAVRIDFYSQIDESERLKNELEYEIKKTIG